MQSYGTSINLSYLFFRENRISLNLRYSKIRHRHRMDPHSHIRSHKLLDNLNLNCKQTWPEIIFESFQPQYCIFCNVVVRMIFLQVNFFLNCRFQFELCNEFSSFTLMLYPKMASENFHTFNLSYPEQVSGIPSPAALYSA